MSGDHNMYASGSGDGQRKQTIQEMAREVGAQRSHNPDLYDIWNISDKNLEAFAALVRADLYKEMHDPMVLACKKMVADEREACAKVCESLWCIDGQLTADEFAAEIRARSNT